MDGWMDGCIYAHACACTACDTGEGRRKADTAPSRASSTIKAKEHIFEYMCVRAHVCDSAEALSAHTAHSIAASATSKAIERIPRF
jgi:hypothetical protein